MRGPRGGLIVMGKDFENPFGQVAAKSGRTLRMSELLNRMVIPGVQGGALMHVVAAKAVGFGENLKPEFTEYAKQIILNARALSTSLQARGFTICSGGTDNHLMLIDLRNKGVNGKDAQFACDEAGITLNKNGVPFDDKSPLITSGIRIGTPAVTTRGMKEADMDVIAGFIDRAINGRSDAAVLHGIAGEVKEFCAGFPIWE
jgi:glycine hydroxymethyltransferase